MVASLDASAQDSLSIRFGYLSYEQALQSMPDYKIAREKTDKLWGQYEAELKRVEDEFNRKYEDFLDGQREFPKTILRKRQTELQELMTKNIAFKEDSRRQLAEAEAEAIAPLKEKLNEVIAKIANERGYAFVINTDAEACPYINPQMGDDINELVTKSLQR
jgi:outer membrane protein